MGLEKLKEDIDTKKEEKIENKKPFLYKVLIHNDDYTPMEFVIIVLKKFFYFDNQKAEALMLKVHNQGQAVCGIYTKDIAQTKSDQINTYARDNEYPLLSSIKRD